MKKILKLPNLALLIVLVLVAVVTLKITEVKATGTVTWPNGSTATITRTVETGGFVIFRKKNKNKEELEII